MAVGFMFVAMGINQIMQAIMHWYPPLWQYTQQSAMKSWPNTLPTTEQLVDMRYKELIDDNEYYDKMSEYGFNEVQSKRLMYLNRSLLSASDYISLNRKGLLSDEETYKNLTDLHFTDEQITTLKNATLYFPAPADLVRFAVREVYTPSIVDAYGLMEDIPEKFLRESEKVGLPVEQAKNFWAAHWNLPSVSQGYEMFHRRVIDKEELKTLMKTLDIMPNWREKLIEISYNPLTRVDVRRMYDLGVLDEEGVTNAYLDAGYSPENAVRMTEFTKKYYEDDLKGLSRANVVKAFKDGLLTEAELKTYLVEFGYSESVAQFWLNTSKYELQNDLINKYITELKDQYVLGMISKDGVIKALTTFQVTPDLLATVKLDLDLLESKRTKLPTREDLETWLKQQVIDENMFNDKMRDLGYKVNDILYYLSSITKEIDTAKPKFLQEKVYSRWFNTGILNQTQYREILGAMGFTKGDIDRLVNENRGKKNDI